MADIRIENQYSTGVSRQAIERALVAAGKYLGHLRPGDLALLEDFHTMGRIATAQLADLVEAQPPQSEPRLPCPRCRRQGQQAGRAAASWSIGLSTPAVAAAAGDRDNVGHLARINFLLAVACFRTMAVRGS